MLIKCTCKAHEGDRMLPKDQFAPSCIRKYSATCRDCLKNQHHASHEANREQRLQAMRQYQADNKAELQQKFQTYYKQNREQRVAQSIAYGKANPEVNRSASQRYRDKNKEQRAKTTKKWRDANKPLTCFLANKRRAQKLKATPPWFAREEQDIKDLYLTARRMMEETGIEYEVDHIIPLQSEIVCGLHCLANLQIITKAENIAKSNKLLDVTHT